MKRLLAVLLLSAVILQAGCAGKNTRSSESSASRGSEDVVPLVGTYKVHRYHLDNGLKLLVVEDHSSPTLAYQTWFRVGSRDENVGYTGLAHLFEHMMFKETKNLKEGEFDRTLELAGVEGLNAFTNRDYTAYIQELPSDKLDLIAKLESDRMVNLVVNEKSFKTETEVVQNERRLRTENNPDGTIYQEIYGLAFEKHPYHWPVIGYQEDLDRMSGKDALEFYRNFYNPAHATIIVVGDVQPNQVFETIKKHYAGLPGVKSPPRVYEPEPVQKAPKRKNMKLNIQVEKLMIGYRVPPLTHEDSPELEVAAAVLAGGKSSRLHRALVDTGIATAVEAYTPGDKDESLFLIIANLQKGKKAAQAEAVINREIQRLQREVLADREMERAKNRLNFDFYSGLGSNYEKARFLGYFEVTANSFEKGVQFRNEVQAVTAPAMQTVVKTFFQPGNKTVITALPK